MSTEISVKFHLYEVKRSGSASITDILSKLNDKQEQHERVRLIGGYPVKMENLARPASGLYIADFCKIRNFGPGKASPDGQTVPFDLNTDEGEGFGETVGMLVSKNKKHVIIQYNHYGIKASAVAQYLSESISSDGGIYFEPIIKADVVEKLKHAESLGWVEAKLNFTHAPLPESYKDNESLRSLWDAINGLDTKHAARIEFKISKRRGNYQGIDKDRGTALLQDILGLSEEGLVSSAKVGAQYSDGSNEMLDFLKAKEEVICKQELAEDQTRIDFSETQAMLAQAYLHWSNKGMIDHE